MVLGSALAPEDVTRALHYNQRRLPAAFVPTVRSHLGLGPGGLDDDFVRAVATWQEMNIRPGAGDGRVGVETEADLNILLPEAQRAADAAERIRAAGGLLYDGWDNDMRDNNGNGLVDYDDPAERALGGHDGSHLGRSYSRFGVTSGSHVGGWREARGTVTVPTSRTVQHAVRYAVCADVISDAYNAARLMPHHRTTRDILAEFRRRGFVWQRRTGYPSQYLPGDFISTLDPSGHGHSAIVVAAARTDGGANRPLVIELPGPSTAVTDAVNEPAEYSMYDPASPSDVVRHRWGLRRVVTMPFEWQYLARFLYTQLHPRS